MVPVASRRLSWQFPWIVVATAVNLRLRRIAVDCSGNYRRLTWQLPLIGVEVAVAITADCRGWPRNAVVCRRNCRGTLPLFAGEITVAIAADVALAIAAEGRGLPWKLPYIAASENYRGNCQLPRMTTECRGFPWKLRWSDVRGHSRGNCRGMPTQLPHGTCRGRIAVAIAVQCRGIRRLLPWIAAAIDVEVTMEYAVAVAVVLPWVAMADPTEVVTERTTTRAMVTTVALAVEAPRTNGTRGPCRGNSHGNPWQAPLKTAEVPRLLLLPSTVKSNNMHP